MVLYNTSEMSNIQQNVSEIFKYIQLNHVEFKDNSKFCSRGQFSTRSFLTVKDNQRLGEKEAVEK